MINEVFPMRYLAYVVGNQSMGLLLLLGTMIIYGSSIPWILPPSHTICALRSQILTFKNPPISEVLLPKTFVSIIHLKNDDKSIFIQAFHASPSSMSVLWPSSDKSDAAEIPGFRGTWRQNTSGIGHMYNVYCTRYSE